MSAGGSCRIELQLPGPSPDGSGYPAAQRGVKADSGHPDEAGNRAGLLPAKEYTFLFLTTEYNMYTSCTEQ